MRVVASCMLTSACAVGPDYTPPELEPPAAYTAELERGLRSDAAALDEWWTTLEDPVLERLVERALGSNLDLREALARIAEARALRGVTRPDLYPTIDVTGSFLREQYSRETPAGAFFPRTADTYSVGFDAGWELDVWGRIRRSIEAADAVVDASFEDARDVLVSVLAETARNYVELRMFQERARIARANVELQARTVELTQNQFNANLVSQLDVSQARANLESTRSTLPPLEAEARAARNRLAVLLGLFPGELEVELSEVRPIPTPPAEISVGVPADVLRRRPDVRRAERQLAAQTARVGVAEGELYPRFTLLGTLGFSAQESDDLFSDDALGFTLSPGVSWNVFDRRRLLNGVRAEDARVAQTLAVYERTVLSALGEVEDAMARFVRDQESRDALETAVTESRRAVELSRDQYRQGLVSFQSVLDTQRRLFELEDLLASTRASITSNLIVLYKALGGGWESRPIVPEQMPGAATQEQ